MNSGTISCTAARVSRSAKSRFRLQRIPAVPAATTPRTSRPTSSDSKRAFDAERRHWEATGQIGYAGGLPPAHDDGAEETLPPGLHPGREPGFGQHLEGHGGGGAERQSRRHLGARSSP